MVVIYAQMDHIRYLKNEPYMIDFGPYMKTKVLAIYDNHIRDRPFPVYDSNHDHIWSIIYGPKPYMVLTTIYGNFYKTIHGRQNHTKPYVVTTYGRQKPYNT